MCGVKLPDLSRVIPNIQTTRRPPKIIRALHRLCTHCVEKQVSAVATYATIRRVEVLLQNHLPPRGHVDGGAMTSCTDRLEYLWSYHSCTPAERELLPELTVADGTKHRPFGYGYLKIPIIESPGYLFVRTYYVPQIPATILSPDRMGRALRCRGYHTYSDFVDNRASMELTDCQRCDGTVHIDLQRIRGLLYTDSLLLPTTAEHLSTDVPQLPRTSFCRPFRTTATHAAVDASSCTTHPSDAALESDAHIPAAISPQSSDSSTTVYPHSDSSSTSPSSSAGSSSRRFTSNMSSPAHSHSIPDVVSRPRPSYAPPDYSSGGSYPSATRIDGYPSSHGDTPDSDFSSPSESDDMSMNILTYEQQRDLWHMRLGHINGRKIGNLHEAADGIPKFQRPDELHKCPMCIQAKLHKSHRNQTEPLECTTCWQDIQVDFGFFVQKSSGRKTSTTSDSDEDPTPV